MSKTIFGAALVMMLLFSSVAFAEGAMSVQMKRTNPGIAGEKSAELIFDIVNTDMTHQIEGFILCRSPDDAVVSSSLGAASGSGAQYISPKFVIDEGPSQKAISLTLDADSPGDKRASCQVKYIPYKETLGDSTTNTEPVTYTGDVGTTESVISGYKVTLLSYVEAIEAQEATDETDAVEAELAKVTIDVDGTDEEIEVGSSETIGALTITVSDASATAATVDITGTKTVTVPGTSVKQFLKMNGEYIGKDTLTDNAYRELRLDKTLPFVAKGQTPGDCPDGKTTCSTSDLTTISAGGALSEVGNLPLIIVVLALLVIVVVYLVGKSSGKTTIVS